MLFEREQLTPQGRLQALESVFSHIARRPGEPPKPGFVPVEVLEAYGDFNAHIRFLLEAATSKAADSTRVRQLHRLTRELDALPEGILVTLPAGPDGPWLAFYRKLFHLHNMLEDAQLELDAEEYSTLILKMVTLAERVSAASAVTVDAASMFSLLLIQIHLRHQDELRHRKPRKKKRRKAPTKKAAAPND